MANMQVKFPRHEILNDLKVNLVSKANFPVKRTNITLETELIHGIKEHIIEKRKSDPNYNIRNPTKFIQNLIQKELHDETIPDEDDTEIGWNNIQKRIIRCAGEIICVNCCDSDEVMIVDVIKEIQSKTFKTGNPKEWRSLPRPKREKLFFENFIQTSYKTNPKLTSIQKVMLGLTYLITLAITNDGEVFEFPNVLSRYVFKRLKVVSNGCTCSTRDMGKLLLEDVMEVLNPGITSS
jgi:hypothetical protein